MQQQMPPVPLINGRKPKIAVAMSGGVDSSMVAYLLAEQGYDLVGFTAWTLNGPGKCCNDALINAGRICEILNIPYDTVDLRAEFSHFVMEYYENSYQEGLTPNPCVECNRHIKWERLIDYACNTLGADYMATGHYARIEHLQDGQVKVFRGADTKKDQTYMLALVRPEDLSRTLFPLAHYQKPDLVSLAKKMDIPTAYSKESQDVCFVLNGQADYLKKVLGQKPGRLIDIDTGALLGEHQGHYLFTLGQRKGVGVAAGRPIYVVKIDTATNTVYMGDAKHLEQSTFLVKDVSWLNPPEHTMFESMVKIRYNTEPSRAQCVRVPDSEDVAVTFYEPVMSITPGQIAAFYDEDNQVLWGGGYIERHLMQRPFDPEHATFPTFDEVCGIFTAKQPL
jgi:tRNA-uridine 2-sulfurtransferase